MMLLDEEADELVFEAVVGEGEDTLIGQRFPAGTGIAGWVLVTRQPLVIEDVAPGPALRARRRRGHGLRPEGDDGVPLLHEERALGVLYVLDRPRADALQPARDGAARPVRQPGGDRGRAAPEGPAAERLLEGSGGDLEVVAAARERVDTLEDEQRTAGVRLLRDLAATLGRAADRTKKEPGRLYIPPGPRTCEQRRCYSTAPSVRPSTEPSTLPSTEPIEKP